MMNISIPKSLAELLVGVCNELRESWPSVIDASSDDEAYEYTEAQAKIVSIRDQLADLAGLSKDLALP